MFVEEIHRESAEYREFWKQIQKGVFQTVKYKRLGKIGREVWIEASDSPVLDRRGVPCRVVKIAADVTAQKAVHSDLLGKVEAISRY